MSARQSQQVEVAEVASKMFGAPVRPENVIGETLTRATAETDSSSQGIDRLRVRIQSGTAPLDRDEFLGDPLASWLESTLGLATDPEGGHHVRSAPRPLRGADGLAVQLAELTRLDEEGCEAAIRETLLRGYHIPNRLGRPTFAFRLHQFISKGETVYASPEKESERYVTLQNQQFVPNSNRSRVLLPLAFCRECGQDYYVVRRTVDSDGVTRHIPRDLSDRLDNDDGEAGFLYINTEDPWPEDPGQEIDRLPDAWIELSKAGEPKVRSARKDRLPHRLRLSADASEGRGVLRAHYMRAPFVLCMNCGVSYSPTQRSDFGKLALLGTEGRSSATSVLTLSTIRNLRRDGELAPKARKILSFTDNRQDASLQAGHFNDFVEIGLVRSALWRAVAEAGEKGLRHDELPSRVFQALNLPKAEYAADPGVQYLAEEETNRALRQVLAYDVYRDLRRGWRVTSPNLEQCGLLKIEYASLQRFCSDEKHWVKLHPALAGAPPEQRTFVCGVLLDFLRRELAIRVDVLTLEEQEKIQRLSDQHLIDPWRLGDEDARETSRVALPRSRGRSRGDRFVFISPRGGYGLFLKRADVFPDQVLRMEDVEKIIPQVFEALTIPGLLLRVMDPRDEDEVPGYQLSAAGMIWRAGDGTTGFHDPIRLPSAPDSGLRTNPYFVDFYESNTDDITGLEAHEHTAQVPSRERERREEKFREGQLPVMFCSPTMELGVDISQLNVVGMRNVPPTPANYAQRSGRAGRSGQPAFVFTYCAAGSPHDQYFFRRPERMVGGQVSPPRLDLGNEELIRAHLHSIWLSAAGLDLGQSLRDVLDLSGEEPSLQILPSVREKLHDEAARTRALRRGLSALEPTVKAMLGDDGDAGQWISQELTSIPQAFESALERWRGLYRSAWLQRDRQHRILSDHTRSPLDRNRARRLRAEAESQLNILLDYDLDQHSDFYTYRYFASEAFLPGYNFPRLPLSAYLPGRRRQKGQDEFLSRPRFLAISEFGPRSYIYHEGSRYQINQVILPIAGDESSLTRRASRCDACGYVHPLGDEPAPDLCQHCGAELPVALDNLFRMENVATRRRDRITSDEEERQRLGYELKTSIRFAERSGRVSAQEARVVDEDGRELARLSYGAAATIWRMNIGWRRRARKQDTGFVLDVERGYWAKNQDVDDDPEDPMTPRQVSVIPYVEDRKNCLLVDSIEARRLGTEGIASLAAALKVAIQVYFQLEDSELAAEPLPSEDERRTILLYESAEGGAGVLQRLVEEEKEFRLVARRALEICHFDPDTLEDRGHAVGAKETCEAACYDCLLSYYNQRDHRLLDRKILPTLLRRMALARLETSPRPVARDTQYGELRNLAQSDLERRWLDRVHDLGLRLPSAAQRAIDGLGVQPDFSYDDQAVVVFVDGPAHDAPETVEDDRLKTRRLEEAGYFVLRFRYDDDWDGMFQRHTGVFGEPARPGRAALPPRDNRNEESAPPDGMPDLDLFEDECRPIMERLADAGMGVEPGMDVLVDGRVIGMTLGSVSHNGTTVQLVSARGADSERVCRALEARGEHVVVVQGNPDDEGRIREALEA
jgi:very-short-patch-repair endonuclease